MPREDDEGEIKKRAGTRGVSPSFVCFGRRREMDHKGRRRRRQRTTRRRRQRTATKETQRATSDGLSCSSHSGTTVSSYHRQSVLFFAVPFLPRCVELQQCEATIKCSFLALAIASQSPGAPKYPYQRAQDPAAAAIADVQQHWEKGVISGA